MNTNRFKFGSILSSRKFDDITHALSVWSELCEECFSEKLNPPSKAYFLRHFFQDGVDESIIALNASGVYVCSDMDGDRLCASVRVYRREIYDNCTPNLSSSMAGIGEVCTLKSVRKQGIARRLMTEALSDSYAATCTYSMLHAASWIWPLYQSLGYVNISMLWTSLSFGTSCPPFSDEKMTFSSIIVKENVHFLHQLYTAFSRRYFGPLKRSIEYFESWIASESDRAYAISHDRELVAYIMVGERYGTVKIKDFGLGQPLVDRVLLSEHGKQSVRHSILRLIFEGIGHYAKSLPHLGNPAPDGTIQEDRRFPDVDVPTALALFLGCCDEDGFYGMKAGSSDEGWMVRSSDGAQPRQKDELFLFWPVDHF